MLLNEAVSMHTAYTLRTDNQKGIKMRDMGSFLGQLLLRSTDRAEQVYYAMKCRGFHGAKRLVWCSKIRITSFLCRLCMRILLLAPAGVLVMNPQLLLLDEPSSMLDPRARRRLITILDSLPQSLLLATHDLDMALDLCDRVILLKKGMIYADGPAAQILSNAQLLDKCGLEPPLSMASLNL